MTPLGTEKHGQEERLVLEPHQLRAPAWTVRLLSLADHFVPFRSHTSCHSLYSCLHMVLFPALSCALCNSSPSGKDLQSRKIPWGTCGMFWPGSEKADGTSRNIQEQSGRLSLPWISFLERDTSRPPRGVAVQETSTTIFLQPGGLERDPVADKGCWG